LGYQNGKERCARGGAIDDFGDLKIAVHRVRTLRAIPPTKLLPPVAVLRGGFSDGREPGDISFSARKEPVDFFFVFFGGLPALIL